MHILLLIAAPSFQSAYVFFNRNGCGESCCEQGENPNEEQKCPMENKNNCCNMACNPFMFCCNCCALVSQPNRISPPFTYSDQKYSLTSESVHSFFLSEEWKPPRLV